MSGGKGMTERAIIERVRLLMDWHGPMKFNRGAYDMGRKGWRVLHGNDAIVCEWTATEMLKFPNWSISEPMTGIIWRPARVACPLLDY